MPCRAPPPPPPAPQSSSHAVQPADNDQDPPIQHDPPLLPPPTPANQQNPLVYRLRSCCLAEFVPRIALTRTQEFIFQRKKQLQQLACNPQYPQEQDCVQQRYHTTCLPPAARESLDVTSYNNAKFSFAQRPTQLWLLANQLLGRPTTKRHFLQQVERCCSAVAVKQQQVQKKKSSSSLHHQSRRCSVTGAPYYRSPLPDLHFKNDHSGSYHAYQSASSLHAVGATSSSFQRPSSSSATPLSPSLALSPPLPRHSHSSPSSYRIPSLQTGAHPSSLSPTDNEPVSPCTSSNNTDNAAQGNPCNDEGALTARAGTDNAHAQSTNDYDDVHHACNRPSTPFRFPLSSVTRRITQQLLDIIQSDGDDSEDASVDQQLEAWMLSHDIRWPDGDYFKATKISMHQGVAQLKRGRRYIFVEPVLGPASSYLYPNISQTTHDDAGTATEEETLQEQSQDRNQDQQRESLTSKDAEAAPKNSSNSSISQPLSSMEELPSTSSSSAYSSHHNSNAVDRNTLLLDPYSPLLDPTTDGQDQFDYGLYELSFIPNIEHLRPKDFVPTEESFLVRLDESRPTLASPVPADSKQSECRCQLMMRKMVMQRELLQVRECVPPILTLAERKSQEEREAMLAQLQLRLKMRALRRTSGGSSSTTSSLRRRRSSLERSTADWHHHYGHRQPSWQQDQPFLRREQQRMLEQQQQRQRGRRSSSASRQQQQSHGLSASPSTMSMSPEGSMPSFCAASELSAALDALSIDNDGNENNELGEQLLVTDSFSTDQACHDVPASTEMQQTIDDSDSEIEAEESYWSTWNRRHPGDHHLHHDGRTRWVDHRQFEMAMTEIDDEQDGDPVDYPGERYLATNPLRRSRRYFSPPPPPPANDYEDPSLDDGFRLPAPQHPLDRDDNLIPSTHDQHYHHHLNPAEQGVVSDGGDMSEYLTATSTALLDYETSCYGEGASSSCESDFDEDECEVPMPSYLLQSQRHYQHQHPWRMPFMTQSSLMPLSRLEETEDDNESEEGGGNNTRDRRQRCSAPPPLLSPSLAPSFTSSLVHHHHGLPSDPDGEDEEGDDEQEEEVEDEVDDEDTDNHDNNPRSPSASELLQDRAMAATYSYHLPNYQQQFRPRPVQDEPWWDPSPPELSHLQQHYHHQPRRHRPQHRSRSVTPTAPTHHMLNWTLEPISARA